MTDHLWLAVILVSACSFILVICILIAIGFLIYTILEIKRAAAELNVSLKNTEERLSPLIHEAEQLMSSVRGITDNIGAVTSTARNLAEAGNDIAVNLRALSSLVNEFGEGLSLRAFGLKAGFRTALDVLIDQIKARR